jgi:outer membrane immunogenic protein
MKKLVLATVLAGIGATSALAADLGARAPYAKAPPIMATVSNWSGFYIGGNVGYGWGNGRTHFEDIITTAGFTAGTTPTTMDTRSNGVIGGAQIGYSWHAGAFVTGLEADIQGSGIKGSINTNLPFLGGTAFSSVERLSWFGTVRGRLGVTATPDLLLYATGGLAFGRTENSANLTFGSGSFPGEVNKSKVGWAAGAGTEWMFARNWSAKIEYLYVDLGESSVAAPLVRFSGAIQPAFTVGYTWKTQDHIVRAGVNYHF